MSFFSFAVGEREWLSRESLIEHIQEWLDDYTDGYRKTVRYFTPIAKDAGVRLAGSRAAVEQAAWELMEQVRNASVEQLDGYWEHWRKVADE